MSQSDPLRPPGKTPRRAEPLQPDRPGRGGDRLATGDDAASGRPSGADAKALEERIEQSDTALDNVRNP